jgi:transcriptional regulator with XRE-family HTH domain
VRGDSLSETVGYLLANERVKAGLSQARLARRLGTSQQWLSKVERGATNVGLRGVQRILAELGRQLKVEAVALGSDLDPEIERNLALNDEDRAWNVEQFGSLLGRLEGVPYAVTGHVGAFVQGLPVSARWIDLVVTRAGLDALAEVISGTFSSRWNPRFHEWGGVTLDPREPGAMRWQIYASEVRVRVVTRLPPTIDVRFGERTLPVVPLTTIEQEDPWLARVGARWRHRAAEPGRA